MGLRSIGLLNVALAFLASRAHPRVHVLNVAPERAHSRSAPPPDPIVAGKLPDSEGIGQGRVGPANAAEKENKTSIPPIIVKDLTEEQDKTWGQPVYPDELPSWSKFEATMGRHHHECDPREPEKSCGVELVCRNGLCSPCQRDNECSDQHRCDIRSDGRNVCVKRQLFDAFGEMDAWLTFWVFACTVLSAASGVGGGGMFVPLFLIFMDMTPSDAVPLSQSLILCSSLINLSFFIFQTHPLCETRAKIDYDTVMLLEPGLACGVIVGVLLNRVSPKWLITALLVVTLGSAFMRTGQKALTLWRKETEKKADAISKSPPGSIVTAETQAQGTAPFDSSAIALMSKYRVQIGIIAIVWLCAFLSNFHRVKSCSWQFMLYMLSFFAAMAGITIACGLFLQQANDPENGRTEDEAKHGISWTFSSTTMYPCVAFMAGLLGGMLGLGGGMILSPFLVELGLHPEVIQATTALFVFLSSSLATFQFALKNQVLPDYAMYYSVVAVVATLVGQTLVLTWIRKSGRNSIIVMCIAGVLIVSLVLMTYLGIVGTMSDYSQGAYMGMAFYKLCLQ
jgi:uncharacterized membrane protein YfcA